MIQTVNGEFIATQYVKKIKIKKIFSIKHFFKFWRFFHYCVLITLVDQQDYIYAMYHDEATTQKEATDLSIIIDIEKRRLHRQGKSIKIIKE